MTDIILLVFGIIIAVFLMSISLQLARIIRLLFVIAAEQGYVEAMKAIGKD